MITVFEAQIEHSVNWELILVIVLFARSAYTMVKKNRAVSLSKILWIGPIALMALSVVGLIILIYVDVIKKINLTGIGVFIVAGLFFIACIGVNYCIRDSIINKGNPFSEYALTLVFSVLALILGCFSFASFQSNDMCIMRAYEAYINGDAEVVEGYVSEFTMAGEGYSREVESFVVDGIEFFYLDRGGKTIYSTQKQSGGVIRGNGQYVKIWYYVDGSDTPMILRIDILMRRK